jgi:hypothetical protein
VHVRGLTEVISGKVRAVICSSRPDSPNCGLFFRGTDLLC